jgi:hypothetical protein
LGQQGEAVGHSPVFDDAAVDHARDVTTVMSTGRLLGGPKNGPVAVPHARTRSQMVSPFWTASSMVNETSGMAVCTPRMASLRARSPSDGADQAELALDEIG